MTPASPSLTVIIPTHKGVERLPNLLRSLDAQTLERSRFEVIFVQNGPEDGSRALLEDWAGVSDTETRILSVPEAGVGRARNVGLANARCDIITFIDDDDWVEPRYLEVGLSASADDAVVLMPIKDSHDGDIAEANSINTRRAMISGRVSFLVDSPWVLGFNACKFLPVAILRSYRYSRDLKSGEDVAFFANLLRYPQLRLVVPGATDDAAYIRQVRTDSVSRRDESFSFSVEERLEVIEALQRIKVPEEHLKARKSLERAQFSFVADYLAKHSEDLNRAVDMAVAQGLTGLPWPHKEKGSCETLVFSFCFPPFADPAANVVAKRLANRRQIVDVVSADMTPVRGVDNSSAVLVDPWVCKHTVIDEYPSFSSWDQIARFGQRAVRAARKQYSAVYSRALWSGSHVAGCLYKLKNPDVFWEAEFSDPLRMDAKGEERKGPLTKGRVTAKLKRAVADAGWGHLLVPNHFALTEIATFILADTLTFSNQNQVDEVLRGYEPRFKELVKQKVRVSPQPGPPTAAYSAMRVELDLDKDRFKIGYFGNFYANRGLGDYVQALEAIPQPDRPSLHVFSDAAAPVAMDVPNVQLHPTLKYLEFLNALTQFDALLVVDTETSNTRYAKNPFLPSKYSDYKGAGVPIWAMVEPGSPLDREGLEYVSALGSADQAQSVLQRLLGLRR